MANNAVETNNNTIIPSPTVAEVHQKGVAEPTSGRKEGGEGQFCEAKPTVHWVSDGWTCLTYKNADGSGAYTVTNGQSALFFDETGNMVLSTGKPAGSGCGGKLILHTGDHHQIAQGSVTIHAKGSGDATRNKDSGSKTKESTTESPAYSLYAEGAVLIEAQGSELGIKGDNVTIVANKTLTLKAPTINIEAGDGSGKVNVFAGDYNLNAKFNNKTVDGEYTDGVGEQTTNSPKPGSMKAVNTAGGINQIVNGEYQMRVLGQYQVSTTDNINFKSDKGGYAINVPGKHAEIIGGVKKTKVLGKSLEEKPPEATWDILLGTNKYGIKMLSGAGFDIKGLTGDSKFVLGGLVNVKTTGILSFKSPSIFLN